MTVTLSCLDMLPTDVRDAVLDAQSRLGDATITARCEDCLWLVERAGVAVQSSLSEAAVVTALAALT